MNRIFSDTKSLGLTLILFAVTACSPLRVISSVSTLGPVERHRDIVFNDHELELDVYAPPQDEAGAPLKPVVVFFYGGSWQSGAKGKYKFVASTLARQGYVVVIPNYRLYPDVVFPEFMHDAAEATRWTFDNVEQYGGNPASVFLMGHSAGAHIAALLHYDGRYLHSANTMNACGFIGLSGPYDFLPLKSAKLQRVFPEESRPASQPVNFVAGDEGPALLVHGDRDTTVKPRNSNRLAELVNQSGGSAEVVIVPKRKHAGVLLALARPLTGLAPVAADVTAFIERQSCL